MSRSGRAVVCCVLFLLVGAISPAFPFTPLGQPAVFGSIVIADSVSTEFQGAIGEHPFELAGTTLASALSFDGTSASSLFAPVSLSQTSLGDEASVSEWEYLWRSSAQIPVTLIPEPTTGSLLVGCAILLWARRTRRLIK